MSAAYRSKSDTQGATSASLVMSNPSGLTDGDYMLAILNVSDKSSSVAVSSAPAGWTALFTSGALTNGASGSEYFWVYGKIASSEPASRTWTLNNVVSAYNCQIVALSGGVNATTPYEQLSSTSASNQATGASLSLSATTTGADRTLITIFMAASGLGTPAWAESAGAEQFESLYASKSNALNLLAIPAAATQAIQGTVTNASANSAIAAVQLALIPSTITVSKDLTASYNVSAHVTKSLTSSYDVAGYATIDSSLFDFDTSLLKLVRGIKVDYDAATDGDGGQIDVFYRTNTTSGAWILLSSNVTAGTEYTLNLQCRSVQVRCVLKKGTSTAGPVLKRIYVRAAPVLQQFKLREFVLDLGGTAETGSRLRDDSIATKTGRQMADLLIAAAQSNTPFSVTDRFGTYNMLVDNSSQSGLEIYEIHPSVDNPASSGSFVARIRLREV